MSNSEEIKPGDMVLIAFSKYGEVSITGPHEVERETKTLLIVGGSKFRKSDYSERADRGPWSGRSELVPADTATAKQLLHTRARKNARQNFRHSAANPKSELTDLENAILARDHLNAYIRLLETEPTK